MSNSEKPGRIIRTSSGSTRLTASSDADQPKPAEAEQNKLAAKTPEAGSQPKGSQSSGAAASAGKAGGAERAADKPKAGSQQAASAQAGARASGPVHSTSKGVRIGGKKDSSDSGAASGSAPAAASGAGSASGAGASAASASTSSGAEKSQQASAKKADAETTVMKTSGTRTTAQGSQNAAQTETVSPSGGEAAASAASGPASGPSAVTASSSQGLRMSGSAQRKGPRTVKLAVSKVDPWSVMKMTFMLSLALGIATIVVMFVLWLVLEVTGTFGSLQAALAEFAGEEGADQLLQVFGLGRILSFAVIIAVVNVILMTALSTLTSIIYNIGSSLVGGFHLTLTDD